MQSQLKVDSDSGEYSDQGDSNYQPRREEPPAEPGMTLNSKKSFLLGQTYDIERPRFEELKTVKAKNETWTDEENRLLFEHQQNLGNSWSQIAKILSRSDNSVKNHFYSTFRKSVRHINKFIRQYCRRYKIKMISNRSLLNILSASEGVRLHKDQVSSETIQKCEAIKHCLINYSSESSVFEMADIIELISQILEVNQEIKLQKNLQTEDVTNTVDKRLTALQDISESFNFQKPEFIPEPEPQIYLCSPMVQTQLYHPSFISVTVPEPQTISYLQPAIYPQTYPMAMYHPQVFYLTMAPWTDSPTG